MQYWRISSSRFIGETLKASARANLDRASRAQIADFMKILQQVPKKCRRM
jgi:hypothetical protein